MKGFRSRTPAARLCFATLLSLSLVLALTGSASAEKILLKSDDWEVFTDGRVAGFISQVNGEGFPVPTDTVVTPGREHDDGHRPRRRVDG